MGCEAHRAPLCDRYKDNFVIKTVEMATTSLTADLTLDQALGYMHRPAVCPEEVRARIAALRVPIDDGSAGGRMTTTATE